MHELLVMPCRNMTEADADFAVCCAVPIDAENLTIISRPAGRPGENAAKFSAKYGQCTAVAIFDDVFVPWDNVFLAGEWQYSQFLTSTYATHHRHTCIGARAGFGDLLIGAGIMMIESQRPRSRTPSTPAQRPRRADQDRRRLLCLRRCRLDLRLQR